MSDEIFNIQQRIKMKEAARNLEEHYSLEEAQELMNASMGKPRTEAQIWYDNQIKELQKTVAYWKETMETWSELVAKVDDVTGEIISNPYEAVGLKKVIDSLDIIFVNVSKHEGIDHELLVSQTNNFAETIKKASKKINDIRLGKDENAFIITKENGHTTVKFEID
jgi:hypothetical protein